MNPRKPPALRKGDTIGIMAPSSRVDKSVVAQAVQKLEGMGFNVYVHPQTYATQGQSAGTPEQKAEALHDLYRNPDIKAIFAAAGGNQAMGFQLDRLDYDLIKQHPKILMGFSDVTIILNAVNKETGSITFHGPTVQTIGRGRVTEEQLTQCFNLLGGQPADMPLDNSKVVHAGTAQGPLIGGNLSLLVTLLGTPEQPDFTGKILFIEDAGDEYSRIDRMLHHLRRAGVFEQVSGIVFGGFDNLKDSDTPYEKTVEQMIREVTDGLEIPVVMEAPFGHGGDLFTLPVGAPARLNAGNGASTLALEGPVVAP